jgi:hypothetical protein
MRLIYKIASGNVFVPPYFAAEFPGVDLKDVWKRTGETLMTFPNFSFDNVH